MSISLLGLLVIGGSIVFALIGVNIAQKLNKGRVQEGHNEVIAPIFATAGVIYAVLIGALVIDVWGAYDNAKSNAAEEASILTTMYRQTSGMPSEEQKIMREHIRKYTEAVVKEEWPLQVNGGASPTARNELLAMYQEFSKMDPAIASLPINKEFLASISSFADDRNRRTLQSQEHLPPVLWFCIYLGSVVVAGLSFFVYMERNRPHIVVSTVFTALIGTLVFVTMAFEKPFSGPLAIDAGSFEHSLSVYNSVDKGGK